MTVPNTSKMCDTVAIVEEKENGNPSYLVANGKEKREQNLEFFQRYDLQDSVTSWMAVGSWEKDCLKITSFKNW